MISGIDPKIDFAFKRLFGSERSRDILIAFLNAVLDPPPAQRVVEVQILNPFNPQEAADDRLAILDVKARDQSNRQFNVEMQIFSGDAFPSRLLFYWAGLYTEQLQKGDPWARLQPTISIGVTDFVLFRESPEFLHRFRLFDADRQLTFTDQIEVYTIELPKFELPVTDLSRPVDCWAWFLRHAADLDPAALPNALSTQEFRRAMEELTMMKLDDRERQLYEASERQVRDEQARRSLVLREGREQGLEEGRQEGRLIGLQQGRQEGLQEGLEEGRQEGREIGIQEGEWIGRIRLAERVLGLPATAPESLAGQRLDSLQTLARRLEQQLVERLGGSAAN